MTRLDRVLNLLAEYDNLLEYYIHKSNHIPSFVALKRLREERYDSLAEVALCDILDCEDAIRSLACLASLRAEKEQLAQELIEHGCRRKN